MAGSPKRKIQLRRGDSSQWVSANPVLSQGEPGYDTTTGALKVGDGLNAWTDLAGLGAGVVVHKECKLRVRQPEFGGGWT